MDMEKILKRMEEDKVIKGSKGVKSLIDLSL